MHIHWQIWCYDFRFRLILRSKHVIWCHGSLIGCDQSIINFIKYFKNEYDWQGQWLYL